LGNFTHKFRVWPPKRTGFSQQGAGLLRDSNFSTGRQLSGELTFFCGRRKRISWPPPFERQTTSLRARVHPFPHGETPSSGQHVCGAPSSCRPRGHTPFRAHCPQKRDGGETLPRGIWTHSENPFLYPRGQHFNPGSTLMMAPPAEHYHTGGPSH